jgi:hypothetical protein
VVGLLVDRGRGRRLVDDFQPTADDLLAGACLRVAMLEKTLAESKPQYRDYIAVPGLLPWFPKDR